MSKLSTKQIVSMFPDWLSSYASEVWNIFLDLDENEMEELLPEYFKIFRCNDVNSLRKSMENEFISPKNWRRGEKRKYSNDEFEDIDEDGFISPKWCTVDKNKCIVRCFYQKNEIYSEKFRLVVITNENDSEILVWNLVID